MTATRIQPQYDTLFFVFCLLGTTLSFQQTPLASRRLSSRSALFSDRVLSPLPVTYVLPILEEWTLLSDGRIQGRIRNHPNIEDGTYLSTSPMAYPQDVLGKDVTVIETLSGSQYLLINPSQQMSENMMNPDFFFAMSNEPMQVNYEMEQQADKEEGGGPFSGTKKLMQQVKDAGIAGGISYALWELGFWAVSVPVCVTAYRQITGHWPDPSNEEDLKQLGAEAFAFVNLARFAVPIRIGLALSTTPWIQTNVVDRFSKKTENEE